MEYLTMLVQLVGGESESVRKLNEAGYSTALDVATENPDTLRLVGGLTAATTTRLIQAAQKHLAESGEGDALGRQKEGPSPVPEVIIEDLEDPAATTVCVSKPRKPRKSKGNRRPGSKQTPGRAAGEQSTEKVSKTVDTDMGVSLEESSALTGVSPENWTQESFWRFG